MAKSYNYKKATATKALLVSTTGLNSDDLAKLKVEPNEDGEFDLYQIISVLRKKWQVSRKAAGGDDDLDAQVLEMQLKQEKLFKERIHNQTRLSLLIPKTEAQNRMIALLQKIRELVQRYIRDVSNDQTSHKRIEPTPRAWTEYLTAKFNALLDLMLEDEIKIKTWEEDGSTKILKTRLLRAENEKDIDDIIFSQTLHSEGNNV